MRYRLVVWVEVSPLRPAVRTDAGIDAYACSGDGCDIPWSKKRGNALSSDACVECLCRIHGSREDGGRDGRDREAHCRRRMHVKPKYLMSACRCEGGSGTVPLPTASSQLFTSDYHHHNLASMNRTPPLVLQTPGFAHYSLAWSPFHTTRIAVASSANYGLVGNGRLHLASVGPGPGGTPALSIDKQ